MSSLPAEGSEPSRVRSSSPKTRQRSPLVTKDQFPDSDSGSDFGETLRAERRRKTLLKRTTSGTYSSPRKRQRKGSLSSSTSDENEDEARMNKPQRVTKASKGKQKASSTPSSGTQSLLNLPKKYQRNEIEEKETETEDEDEEDSEADYANVGNGFSTFSLEPSTTNTGSSTSQDLPSRRLPGLFPKVPTFADRTPSHKYKIFPDMTEAEATEALKLKEFIPHSEMQAMLDKYRFLVEASHKDRDDQDYCVYCSGPVPIKNRNEDGFPDIYECEDCIKAGVPRAGLSKEFLEMHKRALQVAKGTVRLNNNGWFPSRPPHLKWNMGNRRYERLCYNAQLWTAKEEEAFDEQLNSSRANNGPRKIRIPTRSRDEVNVKYWSQGRNLVAGGIEFSMKESNLFFQGLRRFGKHNVEAIQEYINTRTLAEVATVIQAMETELKLQRHFGIPVMTVGHMPMAVEMSEEHILKEEHAASILIKQEAKEQWMRMDSDPMRKDYTSVEAIKTQKAAEMFHLKNMIQMTSATYIQNDDAGIQREVLDDLYDSLKLYVTEILQELVLLRDEELRTRIEVTPRSKPRPTVIRDHDIFRILKCRDRSPLQPFEFFEDLPDRIQRKMVGLRDPNIQVDTELAQQMDSDQDYATDDGNDSELEKEWEVPLPAMEDRASFRFPKYYSSSSDKNIWRRVRAWDALGRTTYPVDPTEEDLEAAVVQKAADNVRFWALADKEYAQNTIRQTEKWISKSNRYDVVKPEGVDVAAELANGRVDSTSSTEAAILSKAKGKSTPPETIAADEVSTTEPVPASALSAKEAEETEPPSAEHQGIYKFYPRTRVPKPHRNYPIIPPTTLTRGYAAKQLLAPLRKRKYQLRKSWPYRDWSNHVKWGIQGRASQKAFKFRGTFHSLLPLRMRRESLQPRGRSQFLSGSCRSRRAIVMNLRHRTVFHQLGMATVKKLLKIDHPQKAKLERFAKYERKMERRAHPKALLGPRTQTDSDDDEAENEDLEVNIFGLHPSQPSTSVQGPGYGALPKNASFMTDEAREPRRNGFGLGRRRFLGMGLNSLIETGIRPDRSMMDGYITVSDTEDEDEEEYGWLRQMLADKKIEDQNVIDGPVPGE